MGDQHPSTVCVELSRLSDSLKNLKEITTSEFLKEELMEFISEYARTDEIMPDDRTLGFIIVNADKHVLSISMSQVDRVLSEQLKKLSEDYLESGFKVDLDLPG